MATDTKPSFMKRILGNFRRNVAPTDTAGAPGYNLVGGYVETREKNRELVSREQRYRVYSDILSNTAIVASGVRYFLNLIANAEWSFVPSEADTDGRYAEMMEEALTDSPATPWHRIVRRAAMYRFYGFGVQEWTMARHADGWLTYKDVAPRAQITIERWDVDEEGKVIGVLQRHPMNFKEIYLPRNKLLYIVDDSLNDSPEGLGLFRHLVEPAKRLQRYEELEGFGFETDLRGIPVGYAPFTELAKLVTEGKITDEDRKRIEEPLRSFVENHIKNPKLGMLLDSIRYESSDEAQRPSNNKQFELELLSGSSSAFGENAAAIERLNRELARILGVEQLLLGAGSAGSFALSKDKTQAFYLLTDGALTEIRESVKKDLRDRLWRLNGWPEEMKPDMTTDAIRFTDAEEAAAVLRDMASAGATLEPDDPAINDMRDLIGVSHADLDAQRERSEADAALMRDSLAAQANANQDGGGDGDEPGDD